MADNLRHAQYGSDGAGIDDPQNLLKLTDAQIASLASNDGIPLNNYTTAVDRAISEAFRLRSLLSAPNVPVTAPTNKSSGNVYYIDGIAGNNVSSGNTPTAPWKDVWKVPGVPGAGATIHLAADVVYEYAATWVDYKARRVDATNAFGANNIGQWTATAANPITYRPYYPRGYTTRKPTIRYHALTAAGDWTQEMSISGGKVWSAAWAKAGNAYYNVAVLFGASRTMGVAWLQQNTSGVPASLVAAGQYAVDVNKVYVYVPDGSNPVSYYGEVRIFGANHVLFGSYNGLCQNVRFHGIRFEQCAPFEVWASNATSAGDNIEIAYCEFSKVTPSLFRQSSAGTPVESVLSFHDNYCEDTHSAVVKLQTSGTAGNAMSWELYRNVVNRGNLTACYGGALLYNQAIGGSKYIAWGNYLFDCKNGIAGEQIDGCGIYSDMQSDKAIFAANIFEQCGKGFQANSLSSNFVAVGNLAIDCGSLGSVTNTGGDFKAYSATVAHNTYLWTGRIQFSALFVGSGIGGTGVQNWANEPAINITNQQANQAGASYNFPTLTLVNNLAINMTGAQLPNKPLARIPPTMATTLLVAGNAPCGMASNAISDANNFSADYTQTARYCYLVGTVSDATSWLVQGANGIARPGVGSPLISAGASLSVQYQDIGGRNFADAPTIGCYEVTATDNPLSVGATGQIVTKGTDISRPCVAAGITVGAKVGSVRTVNIQLRDVNGNPITYVENVQLAVYLDAARTAYVVTGGSTGIAIGANGALLPIVAKKMFSATSEADGTIELTWTDTGTEVAYLGVQLPNGRVVMSSALTN